MTYCVYPFEFHYCTQISWEDVDNQILKESKNNTCRIVGEDNPTIILLDYHNYSSPISNIRDRTKNKCLMGVLHVYVSKNSNAQTMGNHRDDVDVLIVQSIGNMTYIIDNQTIILNPGDGLFIPKGVDHNPIVTEPRVTLSFSQ